METIDNKYNTFRNSIEDGDIILCKNNGWIGKQISKFDNAYFTHSLVSFWKSERLFIFDSTEAGVHPELASVRMRRYSDFCIVRPDRSYKEREAALNKLFAYSEKGIKYDFRLIAQIALYQKTGINTFKKNNPYRDICSELSWIYTKFFPLNCYDKDRIERPFFTPEDFLRFAEEKDVYTLFTEKPQKQTAL